MTSPLSGEKSIIAKYFKDIVISKEIYIAKPHPDIFEHAISNLGDFRKDEILMIGDSKTDTQQHEDFLFMLNKAFNRHNDVCSGYTTVIKDETGHYCVELTGQSSITELNIELSTLINCNRNCVYRINDITKEALPSLQFEAIADLTGAIIASGVELD